MEISQHWRLRKARYSLVGSECACGHKSFPAREVCPVCGAHQSEAARADAPVRVAAVSMAGAVNAPGR